MAYRLEVVRWQAYMWLRALLGIQMDDKKHQGMGAPLIFVVWLFGLAKLFKASVLELSPKPG